MPVAGTSRRRAAEPVQYARYFNKILKLGEKKCLVRSREVPITMQLKHLQQGEGE
jgi:hypothetical protein